MELAAIDKLAGSDDPAERRQAAGLLTEVGDEEALGRLERLVVDPNPAVREVAQDSVIFLGGHEAVRRMAPLVGSPDAGIRNTAIEILRRIGEDGLDILHALAHNMDDRLRLFIVDILGSIGNHDSVDTLLQCLLDENANVRHQAVIALGMVGDPRAFESLTGMLHDEEWIRFAAIEAMAKIPHPAVVDFLLSELNRWSEDEVTLSAILETLAVIPSEKAVRPLLDMIPASSAYTQVAAVSALLQILPDLTGLEARDTAVIKDIIEEHLRQVDDALQKSMLAALARCGDPGSAKCVVELAREVDPDTRAERWEDIRDTLSRLGDRPTIIGLLDTHEEKLQILGAEILARIGGEEETRQIIARIEHVHGHVKRAYVEAVARIGAPASRDLFKQLIHDRDGHVAGHAIRAIGTMGHPDDIDELKPLLAHPYADVREAARDAIVRIGSSKAPEVFLGLLHHDEPPQRVMGLEGLSCLNVPLDEPVSRMLADPQGEVRLAAAQIARDAGLLLSAAVLDTLLRDEHHDIRCAALTIIGQNRIEALRPVLEEAIQSADMWMAYHGIEALGQFRDDEARARLMDIVAGEQDFLRIAAVKALGEWSDEPLADELEIYIDDPNLDVARAVSQAIDKLRGLGF